MPPTTAYEDDTDGQLVAEPEDAGQQKGGQGHDDELCQTADDDVFRAGEDDFKVMRVQGQTHAEHHQAEQRRDPCSWNPIERCWDQECHGCYNDDDQSHVL